MLSTFSMSAEFTRKLWLYLGFDVSVMAKQAKKTRVPHVIFICVNRVANDNHPFSNVDLMLDLESVRWQVMIDRRQWKCSEFWMICDFGRWFFYSSVQHEIPANWSVVDFLGIQIEDKIDLSLTRMTFANRFRCKQERLLVFHFVDSAGIVAVCVTVRVCCFWHLDSGLAVEFMLLRSVCVIHRNKKSAI